MSDLFPLFDPNTALTLQTLLLCGMVLLAGAVALLSLPWTDAEIAQVDREARNLVRPLSRGAVMTECASEPASSSH